MYLDLQSGRNLWSSPWSEIGSLAGSGVEGGRCWGKFGVIGGSWIGIWIGVELGAELEDGAFEGLDDIMVSDSRFESTLVCLQAERPIYS